MARLSFLTTIFVALLYGVTAIDGSDTSTTLKDAVEAINRKTATGYFDQERQRTPPLTNDRWPALVTADEVIAAIRGWDRKKTSVDDVTYRIYQQIAATRLLPTGAELYFRDEWEHANGRDNFEHRVWRIQLDVMTGKGTGYGFVIREQRLDRRIALAAAPGYSWLDAPRPVTLPTGWTASCVIMVEAANDAALVITTGLPYQKGLHDIHIVAFDADGNRHVLMREARWGGVTSEFAMFRFRLDPNKLPAEKVSFIGVEGLSAQGLKHSSEDALRRAKQKMIEVLPLPEMDRPFEFALTATDGTIIDSTKLHGKVVLIDCWASWCVPCMREMPEVKKVFDKWHDAGLEVVGLSLDTDPKAAAAAAKHHEIPWRIVVVPFTDGARELWTEASRIESIPRLLLIDQKGILRADLTSAQKLEEALADLLGRK